MAQHPRWQPPPRVSAAVIIGRILAFATMALGVVWVYVLILVGALTVTAAPCRVSDCSRAFHQALNVALLGALVALSIVAAALPLAWRRGSLAFWSLLAVLVAYGAGLWAYRAEW